MRPAAFLLATHLHEAAIVETPFADEDHLHRGIIVIAMGFLVCASRSLLRYRKSFIQKVYILGSSNDDDRERSAISVSPIIVVRDARSTMSWET
ncbi:hypothetical protein Nham_4091 (plasmid) [Nitrobacter hamburgensis X14]|uniref:Uncharacterized protein n=1 Tax=Nitrobacter hamburgensis (strain DSM 10229 / NCIMB 13809 / X14) TaxID=323097 RepID=Q1QGA4_NITHX|nr:hypothetical protein Nham_4091 [Nitrobacter hamburgensis X14]